MCKIIPAMDKASALDVGRLPVFNAMKTVFKCPLKMNAVQLRAVL